MSFIREHKTLVILMVLSVLVIVAGLWMVQSANQQQQQQADIDRLGRLADQAHNELQKTRVYSDVPIADMVPADIVPADSLQKVQAMAGKVPELGSEAWCELMMVKEADTWTEAEQALFAQRCI